MDLAENFYCEGAPSVFTCGSLGCPYTLFQQREGEWRGIGGLKFGDAPAVEVLPGSSPASLRGGCSGSRPCDELTTYVWAGEYDERVSINARGHQVTVAPAGLWELTRDITVRAGPQANAAELGSYASGAEFVVIGDAVGAPYKYVSPCNACASGFVPADALRKGVW